LSTQGKDKTRLVALRRQARHYAVQALYQWQMSGNALNAIDAQFRADFDFSATDTEYFHELLHEVPVRLEEINVLLAPCMVDRAVDELGPVELAVLRMAMYELIVRIDVPYKVVINEAVALAKKFGATDSHKFVNGVLDCAAQEIRQIETRSAKQ
jgi:transcription antitermination protein NusB